MRANVELDHATLVRFSPDCRWDRVEPQVCLQKLSPRLMAFSYLVWDSDGEIQGLPLGSRKRASR